MLNVVLTSVYREHTLNSAVSVEIAVPSLMIEAWNELKNLGWCVDCMIVCDYCVGIIFQNCYRDLWCGWCCYGCGKACDVKAV